MLQTPALIMALYAVISLMLPLPVKWTYKILGSGVIFLCALKYHFYSRMGGIMSPDLPVSMIIVMEAAFGTLLIGVFCCLRKDIVFFLLFIMRKTGVCSIALNRLYVHLAAVFACNFSNHMYAIAYKLLQEKGLSFVPLLPLVDETVRKIHQLNPVGAQTGPARRWDQMIMNKHESLLKTCPAIADIYKKVSESIHSYAIKEDLIQE